MDMDMLGSRISEAPENDTFAVCFMRLELGRDREEDERQELARPGTSVTGSRGPRLRAPRVDPGRSFEAESGGIVTRAGRACRRPR